MGQGFLRLAAPGSPDGCLLDADRLSGLQNGDSLAAIALQPKIAATCRAFALWVVGGDTIVTWGHPDYGGNSSKVRDQLRSVQQVCSTEAAFAAVLVDGTVVTWGDPSFGGDSSTVRDRLKNVQDIYGAANVFLAFLADGGKGWHGAVERSRFLTRALLLVLLLRAWHLHHGAVQTVVVTAPESNICS